MIPPWLSRPFRIPAIKVQEKQFEKRILLLRGQRFFAWLVFPLLGPLIVITLRFGCGYRIHGLSALREQFQRIVRSADGPVLICPNHLTMIDSAILMWAFDSTCGYWKRFHTLAWNFPARETFVRGILSRVFAYLVKCIPIDRLGSGDHIADVLWKAIHLLESGQVLMLFPEGTRSRTGRVEPDEVAYGVGRIVADVENCNVLCVYMRGDHQHRHSDFPARNEKFYIKMELIKPRTEFTGIRAHRDLARQVIGTIKQFEDEYFTNWDRLSGRPARKAVSAPHKNR